jgi:hypothetical protein
MIAPAAVGCKRMLGRHPLANEFVIDNSMHARKNLIDDSLEELQART